MAVGKSLKRPVCFDRAGRLIDARVEFVVIPPAGRAALSVGGAVLLAGQRFDKGLVNVRRLRQMYESRLIAIASESILPSTERRSNHALGPADTSFEQPQAAIPTSSSRPRAVPRKRLIRAV